MDESDSILYHTVSRTEKTARTRSDKGIARPARHLVKDIGPRPPGSAAERSALRYVNKELKDMGYITETQRFKTPVTTSWSEFIVHLVLVLGVLLFPLSSHLSFGLIFLGFLLFLLEEYGRSPFSWLQPHRSSENVLTKIEPLRSPKKTLVIAAHCDSPRSAFYYRPGLVTFFRSAVLLDFICQAVLFMLFIFTYGGSLLNMDVDTLNFLWLMGLLLLIIPIIVLIALLLKASRGKATPGGNNNASGIAVLLELARIFSRRQPLNIEIWLVFTGASDASGLGIRRLVRENRGELKGAYYIMLDQVGRGCPLCYRREGKLITFRANRRLTSLAKEVSSAHAHYSAGFGRNTLYISDGFQLISRGKKAITLSAREKSRYPRYWKWKDDNYENIDPRSLRLTLDFARAMADRLDKDNSRR